MLPDLLPSSFFITKIGDAKGTGLDPAKSGPVSARP